MDKIIKEYCAIVRFLGHFIGNNTEIVLHDTTQADHSVVAIINGHISGRKIGSSLNGAALSYIRNKIYQDKDELLNYRGFSKEGHELICYTRFIKNEAAQLLGMMCVNIDKNEEITVLKQLRELFRLDPDDSSSASVSISRISGWREHFPENVGETVEFVFREILEELQLPSDRLTYSEKLMVMKKLEEKGVFLFKGAIPEVARQLAISEATAYRYLSKIERGSVNGQD